MSDENGEEVMREESGRSGYGEKWRGRPCVGVIKKEGFVWLVIYLSS